jgi:hypothetical protein
MRKCRQQPQAKESGSAGDENTFSCQRSRIQMARDSAEVDIEKAFLVSGGRH